MPIIPAPTAPPVEPAQGQSGGYWRGVGRRFRRQRAATLALVFLVCLALLALLAPFVVGTRPILCRYKGELHAPVLADYWRGWESPVFYQDRFRGVFPRSLQEKDPDSWALWPLVYQSPYGPVRRGDWPGDPGNRSFEAPSGRHPFGTGERGKDVLARVVYGARVALLVGVVSMAIAGAIGVVLGSLAGYFGGVLDVLISRAIEVMMSIPTLVLVLALLAVVPNPGVGHLMLVIGLTRWESIARYTRGEFLRLRESDFVLAAKGLGAPWYRIVLVHILPNALAPVLVTLSFGVANAILIESALSFLGFGVPPPTPSWGGILSEWLDRPECWWLAVFPGLAIFASVVTYNLIGDGLQDAINPRAPS